MVRTKFWLFLAAALVLLAFSGCEDPINYGFSFGGDVSGVGILGDEENCPIPVPTPDPDVEPEPTPEPTPDPEPTATPGEDDDEEDSRPANGRQCEVNEFTVCHFPRGNPDNYFTICMGSEAAFEAHLGHGDLEGACEDE